MHSITISLATDPYYAKSPVSLSAIATNASNIFLATDAKATLTTNPSSHLQHKKMPRQQSLFSSFTHTLCPTFLLFATKRGRNKCLSAHKQTRLHTFPSYLNYRSTSPSTTVFLLSSLHFISNSSTFADITQSANNILPYFLPPHHTNFPNSFKIFKFNHFKLTILFI